MVASRIRPKGTRYVPFGLSALCTALMPTPIGYQDLAALIARQPAVSERWRQHLIASPFGTIHAATFSFPRPVGTAMPEPLSFRLANFDPRALDLAGINADTERSGRTEPQIDYPVVNRRLKGDRLSPVKPSEPLRESLPQLQPIEAKPEPPPTPESPPTSNEPASTQQIKQAEEPAERGPQDAHRDDQPQASAAYARARPRDGDRGNPIEPQASASERPENDLNTDPVDAVVAADMPPDVSDVGSIDPMVAAQSYVATVSYIDGSPATRSAQIFFGIGALSGASLGGLEQWAPGAEPILVSPSVDPDIKLSALAPIQPGTDSAGETVASKGEVSTEVKRPRSPAERLGLEGKARAKAEKCLADAVYFESRGETLRGQMAVAQVVMNRVFSRFYPNNVCSVVYQNAHRRLACQFTFACDGIRDRVTEPDMWVQAKRIAKDTLDGKIWLPEVGHATHYHAYWVRPSWVNEMKKMYKLGVHTFYRPRAWGNGADEPVWGDVPSPVKPEAAAKDEPTAKL
jgi:spore germination cell wall hydrolase CwlJ-like protein